VFQISSGTFFVLIHNNGNDIEHLQPYTPSVFKARKQPMNKYFLILLTLFISFIDQNLFADFNGDGKPDFLWRHKTTGELAAWYMNGVNFISPVGIAMVNPIWELVGTPDLNGDGKADFLWRHKVTGELAAWYMNGVNFISPVGIAMVDPVWELVGTPDLNGDGKSDFLWRHKTTGELAAWYMNGVNFIAPMGIAMVDPVWELVGTPDLNGDGKSDFLWRHKTTGELAAWYMNGVNFIGSVGIAMVDPVWELVGTPDLNGNGRPDFLWRHRTTGELAAWYMNGVHFISSVGIAMVDPIWETAALTVTTTPAILKGVITDQETAQPIQGAQITLGEITFYTNSNGYYEINGLSAPKKIYFSVIKNNYENYSELINTSAGENQKNIALKSTGTYNGQADREYEIQILKPETGYAHVKGIFKKYDPFAQKLNMSMHYSQKEYISIENIVVTNDKGIPLPYKFTNEFQRHYYFSLEIETMGNSNIIFEYDIHYVAICHNGDLNCIHAHITDNYGVFEVMGNLLFDGGYALEATTAVKFILPDGWVKVTPWNQSGDYFVGTRQEIMMAAPAVGRFEVQKASIRNNIITVGIHEKSNDYVSESINFSRIWKILQTADTLLRYTKPFSTAIVLPPIGTNETGLNSNYSPAIYVPYGFSTGLSLVNDMAYNVDTWTGPMQSFYFAELILYQSGEWSKTQYDASFNFIVSDYLNKVYGTNDDLPIASFRVTTDPKYSLAKFVKNYLFFYILDQEIQRVTAGQKSIVDVLLWWRTHITHWTATDSELFDGINNCTGGDFTDFFNKYFYGLEKYPVALR
jgi:hypothetical protein